MVHLQEIVLSALSILLAEWGWYSLQNNGFLNLNSALKNDITSLLLPFHNLCFPILREKSSIFLGTIEWGKASSYETLSQYIPDWLDSVVVKFNCLMSSYQKSILSFPPAQKKRIFRLLSAAVMYGVLCWGYWLGTKEKKVKSVQGTEKSFYSLAALFPWHPVMPFLETILLDWIHPCSLEDGGVLRGWAFSSDSSCPCSTESQRVRPAGGWVV